MKWLKRSGLVLTLIIFSLLGMLFHRRVDRLQETTVAPPILQTLSDSPLPTPEPTPTPLPLSPEAQAALTYLAEQKQIPRDQLVVTSEEVRDFPLLDRRYVLVTLQPATMGLAANCGKRFCARRCGRTPAHGGVRTNAAHAAVLLVITPMPASVVPAVS